MTCFLVDDQLATNRKMMQAIEAGGADVVSLWTLVGSACSGHNTEGAIEPAVINSVARTLMLGDANRDAAIDALAAAGIWHTPAKARRCDPCLAHIDALNIRIPKGGYLWHGWRDQNFSAPEAKDPIAKLKKARDKHLHNSPEGKHVKVSVRQRDGDRCRYCSEHVSFTDRISDRAGTYDHRDPNLLDADAKFVRANSLDNLVVACKRCNGEKKNRTPIEWVADGGRPLQPPPGGDR